MDEKERKRRERTKRAREQVENDELGRRLGERIAYIERELEEQRQARERAAQRGWRFWRFRRAG
jgi:hypothetical protein